MVKEEEAEEEVEEETEEAEERAYTRNPVVPVESDLLCPRCGETHPVFKAPKAFYIEHGEGEDREVFKVYLRKRMPRVEE